MSPKEQQDAADMMGKDIYVKYTDKHSKSHVSYHRVWDIGLFMETKKRDAAKEGGIAEQVMKP